MYRICDVTQDDLDFFFLSDPKLVMLGVSDEEIHLMFTNGRYYMSPHSNYFGVRDDESIKLIVKYEWFTTHCINFHMYARTKDHGTGAAHKMVPVVKQYFSEIENARKAIMMVPSSCEHVLKFADKHGWVKEGCITNCYYWRQKPVDIVIMGLNLKYCEEN